MSEKDNMKKLGTGGEHVWGGVIFFSEVREGDAWAETCWRKGTSHPEVVRRVLVGGVSQEEEGECTCSVYSSISKAPAGLEQNEQPGKEWAWKEKVMSQSSQGADLQGLQGHCEDFKDYVKGDG